MNGIPEIGEGRIDKCDCMDQYSHLLSLVQDPDEMFT